MEGNGGMKDYVSDRVFDGAKPLSPERATSLRENYYRTHGFFAGLTPAQQAAVLANREVDV